jgi:flagellar biosynthesis/type III secretory pathway chaperone
MSSNSQLIYSLYKNFTEQIAIFSRLKIVLNDEYTHLTDSSSRPYEIITNKKSSLLDLLFEKEEERLSIKNKLESSLNFPNNTTLSTILDRLDINPPFTDKLMLTAGQLNEIALEVYDLNGRNQEMITKLQSNLYAISDHLKSLMQKRSLTYNNQGSLSKGIGPK